MAMPVSKTIVFVTIDVGNGNALKAVAKKAKAQGHPVFEFYGEGKLLSEETLSEIQLMLNPADWLVVSISSNEEKACQEGQVMALATRLGIKILIVSDIDGMMHRSRWCAEHARNAHTITVVNSHEIEWTRQFVSPQTRIVCVPNPCWISFFNKTKSREDVYNCLGIAPDAKLIVVPGDKEIERMIARLILLVKAIQDIGTKLHIVVTVHPGADHTVDVFKRIVKYSRYPITFSVQKETGISTQDAISACDLAITGNGSSTGYIGACQCKPMICVIDPLVDTLYWKNLSGQKTWSLVEIGASALAQYNNDLRSAMIDLLEDGAWRYTMLETQRTRFGREMFESATDDILALIEE